jgi:hypothetical protein
MWHLFQDPKIQLCINIPIDLQHGLRLNISTLILIRNIFYEIMGFILWNESLFLSLLILIRNISLLRVVIIRLTIIKLIVLDIKLSIIIWQTPLLNGGLFLNIPL